MSSKSEEISQLRQRDLPFLPLNFEFVSTDVQNLEELTGFSSPSAVTPATPDHNWPLL